MIKKRITIINKLGLHARATSKFVSTAAAFGCSIKVGKGEQWVDGKSIMSVMMLAACQGTELELECDGADEKKAMKALTDLINDYFGEGQ